MSNYSARQACLRELLAEKVRIVRVVNNGQSTSSIISPSFRRKEYVSYSSRGVFVVAHRRNPRKRVFLHLQAYADVDILVERGASTGRVPSVALNKVGHSIWSMEWVLSCRRVRHKSHRRGFNGWSLVWRCSDQNFRNRLRPGGEIALVRQGRHPSRADRRNDVSVLRRVSK